MKILITAPNLSGAITGNRITATRWKRLLQALGHHVTLKESYERERADLLIALHATKSHPSVKRFRERNPEKPIIVGLAGTDLYQDTPLAPATYETLQLADVVLALQPLAKNALPPPIAQKTVVIYQSAVPPRRHLKPLQRCFEMCLVANLREVKDPFLAEEASRLLPSHSRIRITHIGSAYEPSWKKEAEKRTRENKRYLWLGEQGHTRTLQLIDRAKIVLLTSKSEGGANVISEALACGKPLLCSEIPGTVGILGKDYPGYFPPGDKQVLAELMQKAETDREFSRQLHQAIKRSLPKIHPKTELQTWRTLLRLWLPPQPPLAALEKVR